MCVCVCVRCCLPDVDGAAVKASCDHQGAGDVKTHTHTHTDIYVEYCATSCQYFATVFPCGVCWQLVDTHTP